MLYRCRYQVWHLISEQWSLFGPSVAFLCSVLVSFWLRSLFYLTGRLQISSTKTSRPKSISLSLSAIQVYLLNYRTSVQIWSTCTLVFSLSATLYFYFTAAAEWNIIVFSPLHLSKNFSEVLYLGILYINIYQWNALMEEIVTIIFTKEIIILYLDLHQLGLDFYFLEPTIAGYLSPCFTHQSSGRLLISDICMEMG